MHRQLGGPADPAAFRILTGLQLGAAVFAVLFALADGASRASSPTDGIGLGLVAALAASTWFVAPRFAQDGLDIAYALTGFLIAGMATQATHDQGQLAAGLMLGMLAVSTGFFVPGRRMWLVLAVEIGAFGIALLINPLLHLVSFLVLVLATVALATATAQVSRNLRGHADRDPLTRVLNRHGFEDHARLLAAVARRGGQTVVIGYLDLDGFKHYNDVNGHTAGDRLLVDATTAWSGVLRSGDLLVRYGGDEFLVLLALPSVEQADVVIDRMRRAFPVEWSIGLAPWRTEEDLYTAIGRADDALLAAKGQGAQGTRAYATRGPWPDRWSEPARMRAALAAMLDPHLLLEPIRSAEGPVVDFLIVDANDAACRFIGRAQGDLIGTCVRDIPDVTPPDWVMEQYARTMNTGEPLVLDGLAYRHPGLGPDEHYLDVRAAPFAGALSVTWRDVTDRMRQARSGE